MVLDVASQDGKTFSKEYSRNVRGKRRAVIDNSQRIVSGEKIKTESTTYANKHYRYIERTLNATLGFIAEDNGLIMARVQDSGLVDEYNYMLPATLGDLLA